MFVRYAYPPNALGYCGPADFAAFREYAVAGVVDRGLVRLARAFGGAWPYLELIAAGCGIGDPLDRRVVEAYWVGNDLLDKVPVTEIGDSMQDRFRHRTGQLPVPGRGRAGRRGPAPQLRGLLRLPVDRAAGRRPQGQARAHGPGPVPDPVGQGDRRAGRPGHRRVPAAVLGRPAADPGRARHRDGPAGPGWFGSAHVRRARHRPGRLGLAALGLDLRPAQPAPAPRAARLHAAPPGPGQPPRRAPRDRRRPRLTSAVLFAS